MSIVAKKLPYRFYQHSTLAVAQSLLGCILRTKIDGKETSGIIVETEAYHQESDEASHSYRGLTKRTEVMFGPPGHAYVYFIYGAHFCVNVVTEAQGVGAAVLIRALEPLIGIPVMQHRRGTQELLRLTNGPGKLCQALGITKAFNGESFLSSPNVSLLQGTRFSASQIITAKRIGISKSKELPWRFYLKDNPHVSRAM